VTVMAPQPAILAAYKDRTTVAAHGRRTMLAGRHKARTILPSGHP
jgi:hypothetical protein